MNSIVKVPEWDKLPRWEKGMHESQLDFNTIKYFDNLVQHIGEILEHLITKQVLIFNQQWLIDLLVETDQLYVRWNPEVYLPIGKLYWGVHQSGIALISWLICVFKCGEFCQQDVTRIIWVLFLSHIFNKSLNPEAASHKLFAKSLISLPFEAIADEDVTVGVGNESYYNIAKEKDKEYIEDDHVQEDAISELKTLERRYVRPVYVKKRENRAIR